MSDSVEERPGQIPGLLRVMVLGGYGVIGSAIMRLLIEAGHNVTGAGTFRIAASWGPGDAWQIFDIGAMSVEGWREAFQDIDVVVNASGALQDGARDDLTAIHETALVRMAEALAGTGTRFVQISAAGVSLDASTEFFRSKARGEVALAPSEPVILRPTLVLSPQAYGGTALLRAAAALPFIVPNVLPRTLINCVHVDDVSSAVLDAVEGRIATGTVVDVTGEDALPLPDLIRTTRDWLGIAEPKARMPVPSPVLRLLSSAADLAGWFGWRSPLRSTSLTVLKDGVRGDPEALAAAGGRACRALDDIFATLPATPQERWFARLWFLMPLGVLTLSLFWIVSGLIGFFKFDAATDVITARGMGGGVAAAIVAIGGLADILLGLLIVWRPYVKTACMGMIGLSLAYLAGATAFVPDLWVDPLGPLVKVVPATLLPLFVMAVLDDR